MSSVLFANLALKVTCVEVKYTLRIQLNAVSEKYPLLMQRSVIGITLIPVLGLIMPMQALAFGMASLLVHQAHSATLLLVLILHTVNLVLCLPSALAEMLFL